MFIPGQLISVLTFPGIIVHEMAHKFFCDVCKVPVYEVSYFKFSRTPGYVIHAPVANLLHSFLISICPLLINSLLCMVLTFSAFIPLVALGLKGVHPVFYVLMWLGISMGMHAFPSPQDAANFKALVKTADTNFIVKFLAGFFVIITSIAHVLKVIWFDLFYAIGLSWVPPLVLGLV
ncbi:MAG: metalloprotease family protein [Azoarcus sp.]|jgi:hypothetical protein|nr:metalloprotease family protein [Azoarcus sp.]